MAFPTAVLDSPQGAPLEHGRADLVSANAAERARHSDCATAEGSHQVILRHGVRRYQAAEAVFRPPAGVVQVVDDLHVRLSQTPQQDIGVDA
eukprot:3731424-Pyramimonas_sp.AAC.1